MFRAIEGVYKINRSFGSVRALPPLSSTFLPSLQATSSFDSPFALSLQQKLKEIGPNPSSPKALGDLLMRWVSPRPPFLSSSHTPLSSSLSPGEGTLAFQELTFGFLLCFSISSRSTIWNQPTLATLRPTSARSITGLQFNPTPTSPASSSRSPLNSFLLRQLHQLLETGVSTLSSYFLTTVSDTTRNSTRGCSRGELLSSERIEGRKEERRQRREGRELISFVLVLLFPSAHNLDEAITTFSSEPTNV